MKEQNLGVQDIYDWLLTFHRNTLNLETKIESEEELEEEE
jgi:hypothetical protein